MKCSVCGCGLANDLKGREAHMKKYHAITLEAPKQKTYVPMDPKEKAEKIARMEARLASKIVLDDKGDFKGYGEPVAPKAPVVDDCSAIDDARLDIWNTPKPEIRGLQVTGVFIDEAAHVPEPVQGVSEPNVAPDALKPIVTQAEFEERLEKLYQQSEAFHKEFMAKFGGQNA